MPISPIDVFAFGFEFGLDFAVDLAFVAATVGRAYLTLRLNLPSPSNL
jgi:hypothetical protein